MPPYPILLEPILKHRVWGGRRLEQLGRDLPPDEPIGESWELADLPERIEDGRSVIANGPWRGRTLRQALAVDRDEIMGTAALTDDGGFPLLVKYLDAQENLSVQVHPPLEYTRSHPGTDVKNEAWVVLDADPGAVIYRGIRSGVTPEKFAADITGGAVVDHLVAVPARPGDCHYLPSGTCHALGAGVLVAEVQTPSDTTFRVYDWGRTGRTIHVAEALACIEFSAAPTEEPSPPEPILVDGLRTTPLVRTPFFELERIDVVEPAELPVVTDNRPLLWMVTSGAGILAGGDIEVALSAGTTVLMPAALEDGVGRLERGSSLINVMLPSPVRDMLA
ncbi:MAG: class I mannose-6-phosphate isomerase [Planctomycetes bacterium]|nr:class I mannose-6-phosphate isomerase [Planctomycetota bacterium]